MDMSLKQLKQWIEDENLKEALDFCENSQAYAADPEFYNLQGILCCKIGELELAETCFQHALVLNPEYNEARDNLDFFYTQCGEEILIDTSACNPPEEASDIYESRSHVVDTLLNSPMELSIGVLAYNRYEKTKACVDSIIQYAADLEYQLILVDHGSDDERILDYFRSVPHLKKKIVRVSKNMESVYAGALIQNLLNTKFCLSVASDVVVTENAIQNLLKCIKSDLRIGCVVSMCSNISNWQQVDFDFKSEEEMQVKAKHFNVSNPLLWEERLRVIPQLLLCRKECSYAAGLLDPGFFHDFGDDDYSYRLRHAGYKTIVCGDAWVHHNHDFRNLEDKTSEEKFRLSLQAGKEKFREKHFGIDAWDDINNFEQGFIYMANPKSADQQHTVLGIDVLCGTPILELKNKLRKSNCLKVQLSAFTQEAKYFRDLQTICDEVVCDRIEYLLEKFDGHTYDYILVGTALNQYQDMWGVLDAIKKISKAGTQIFVKLQNTDNWTALFRKYRFKIDNMDISDSSSVHKCSVEEFASRCNENGFVVHGMIKEQDARVAAGMMDPIKAALKKAGASPAQFSDIYVKNYCFKLTPLQK